MKVSSEKKAIHTKETNNIIPELMNNLSQITNDTRSHTYTVSSNCTKTPKPQHSQNILTEAEAQIPKTKEIIKSQHKLLKRKISRLENQKNTLQTHYK